MDDKSLRLRVSIPLGVAISEHLEQFPAGKARSHELVRLAELSLMGLVTPTQKPNKKAGGNAVMVNRSHSFSEQSEDETYDSDDGPDENRTGVDFRGALDSYL